MASFRPKQRAQLCRFWEAGSCKHGEKCRFVHGRPLRSVAPARLLKPPSYANIPAFSGGWGLSEEEYAALQAQRRAFAGLACSPRPYTRYDGRLNEQEMRSFKAAGYFLWRLGEEQAEVLMCWEDRRTHKNQPTRRLLGFPGGRRDRNDEEPIQVAARETDEETGRLLSPDTTEQLQLPKDKPAIWIPSSKYALFLHELTAPADQDIHLRFSALRLSLGSCSKYALFLNELTAPADQDIHLRFSALPRDVDAGGGPLPLLERGGDPEVVALQWVPASVIAEHNASNFHPFVQEMIRALLDHKILPL